MHKNQINAKAQRNGQIVIFFLNMSHNICSNFSPLSQWTKHKMESQIQWVFGSSLLGSINIIMSVLYQETSITGDQSLETFDTWILNKTPWQQGLFGQHGAHLGPTGPRWVPCSPHELCYCWEGCTRRSSLGASQHNSQWYWFLLNKLNAQDIDLTTN